MSISEVKKIHFIGIGGIGMSGLARLFLREGREVSGSDRAPSDITHELEKEGVKFFPSQAASNITDDVDMIVYTEAMSPDQEEMVAAKKLGVPMVNYFEALATVANEYYLIAVSGTHGKTTTTAMLIDVFEDAGLDPTAIVGSLRSKSGSNYRAGKSKYFIAEACEYRRDFLSLEPDVLVITNIEAEHLDYYKDLSDVQDAFHTLALKVPESGVIVCDTSDSNVIPVIKNVKAKIVDYRQYIELGMVMKQPGLHTRKNAAAALAAAAVEGIDEQVAKDSLKNCAGTWRRFEYKGDLNGAPIYDDYAHHPTEINATIQGARELYPDKNIVVVFQPHLYSRTEELFDEFVSSLSKANRIILTHVYDARNTGKAGVTGEKLAEAVKKQNFNTKYIEEFSDIVSELKSTAVKDDVVLVIGAGDVLKISENVIKK